MNIIKALSYLLDPKDAPAVGQGIYIHATPNYTRYMVATRTATAILHTPPTIPPAPPKLIPPPLVKELARLQDTPTIDQLLSSQLTPAPAVERMGEIIPRLAPTPTLFDGAVNPILTYRMQKLYNTLSGLPPNSLDNPLKFYKADPNHGNPSSAIADLTNYTAPLVPSDPSDPSEVYGIGFIMPFRFNSLDYRALNHHSDIFHTP